MSEVKICNHFAFTSFERLADDLAFRVHNGGEAAAGNRPDSATHILHDLGLLIVIEPRRRADYKASRFEGVLADINFRLLRK